MVGAAAALHGTALSPQDTLLAVVPGSEIAPAAVTVAVAAARSPPKQAAGSVSTDLGGQVSGVSGAAPIEALPPRKVIESLGPAASGSRVGSGIGISTAAPAYPAAASPPRQVPHPLGPSPSFVVSGSGPAAAQVAASASSPVPASAAAAAASPADPVAAANEHLGGPSATAAAAGGVGAGDCVPLEGRLEASQSAPALREGLCAASLAPAAGPQSQAASLLGPGNAKIIGGKGGPALLSTASSQLCSSLQRCAILRFI